MPNTNIPKPHTETENERLVLLHRIEDTAETPLAFLGLAWLVLLIIEFTRGLNRPLEITSYVIWGIFILDFLLKFILAPRKVAFLKNNWLTVISLLLPALRVGRFLRVFRGPAGRATGESAGHA